MTNKEIASLLKANYRGSVVVVVVVAANGPAIVDTRRFINIQFVYL